MTLGEQIRAGRTAKRMTLRASTATPTNWLTATQRVYGAALHWHDYACYHGTQREQISYLDS